MKPKPNQPKVMRNRVYGDDRISLTQHHKQPNWKHVFYWPSHLLTMSFKTRFIKLFMQKVTAPDPKPKCRYTNYKDSVDD